jgi:hypothetical protein
MEAWALEIWRCSTLPSLLNRAGGSFLQAPLGYNPSYAWRSIVNARAVLDRGLIWRVGNGESIKVWGDKWLPVPTSYKVHSPIRNLDLESRVCDRIDHDSGWWNVAVIRDTFIAPEAEAICSLALSPLGQPDKPVWVGTSNGRFSVKSAYHMEMARKAQERGE